MKSFALTAAALTALAAAPVAALDLATGVTVGIGAEADVDGNGSFSLEELQAEYPELNAETFAAIDADADGEVDQDEMKAAVDAGVLAKAGWASPRSDLFPAGRLASSLVGALCKSCRSLQTG
ncbi:hypothetical protein [Leisingera sp.]|uniref:hypothetical protein n=1 Tax=Leisingera sp. TaxID=1879318 RepID=UPI002B26DAD1|nr:hypothetical protein [Leisingera sp.]